LAEMSRRNVLGLAATCGMAALAGCANDPESDRPPRGAEGTPPSTDLSTPAVPRELSPLTAVPDGGVVDVTAAAGEPAYLIRRGDSIRAVSGTCTHASCRVAWQANSERFECPCHRGTYDSEGLVISGPPPRALEELRVVVDDGVVYLDP
jgi:cytochrome b6-f complex iron-sulfur subunit